MLRSGYKKCAKCNKNKTIEEFYLRHDRENQYSSYCKQCYSDRKKAERNTFVAGNNARRNHIRAFVLEYLKNNPCIVCGESDPIVLDFDHRNKSEKIAAVTSMVIRGFSLKRIENEIAKCDVRCANCHRRKTAEEINSYRWQMLNE